MPKSSTSYSSLKCYFFFGTTLALGLLVGKGGPASSFVTSEFLTFLTALVVIALPFFVVLTAVLFSALPGPLGIYLRHIESSVRSIALFINKS